MGSCQTGPGLLALATVVGKADLILECGIQGDRYGELTAISGTEAVRVLRLVQTTNKLQITDPGLYNGADDGNRTRALSLGITGARPAYLLVRPCTRRPVSCGHVPASGRGCPRRTAGPGAGSGAGLRPQPLRSSGFGLRTGAPCGGSTLFVGNVPGGFTGTVPFCRFLGSWFTAGRLHRKRAGQSDCSPCLRGWTHHFVTLLEESPPLPAPAGMDPTGVMRRWTPGSAPRTRGDGPVFCVSAQALPNCSPHPRNGPMLAVSREGRAVCSPYPRGWPAVSWRFGYRVIYCPRRRDVDRFVRAGSRGP
jgi:hypothetical protein